MRIINQAALWTALLLCLSWITHASPAQANFRGGWVQVEDTSDNFDQTRNVAVFLPASSKSSTLNNETVVLIVRCQRGLTEVSVYWDRLVSVTDRTSAVDSRVDDGAVRRETWLSSSNGKGAFHPSPTRFLRSLIASGAQTLALRTFTYGGMEFSAQFELEGIQNAIAPVREACGW